MDCSCNIQARPTAVMYQPLRVVLLPPLEEITGSDADVGFTGSDSDAEITGSN